VQVLFIFIMSFCGEFQDTLNIDQSMYMTSMMDTLSSIEL
jgi:hypothetical protein